MKLLPLIDTESFLTGLKHNAGSDLGTEHHLGAIHIVVHDILKSWLTCVLVDHEEVDFLVSSDLDSNIALDEIDFSAHIFESVVFYPEPCFFIDLEEENVARRPNNESFLKEQVHRAHVIKGQLFELALSRVGNIDGEALTLPIESVNTVGDRTVK